MVMKTLVISLLLLALVGRACSKDDLSSVRPAANCVLASQNYSSLTYSSAGGNVRFTDQEGCSN
jgi:hypothetical protein